MGALPPLLIVITDVDVYLRAKPYRGLNPNSSPWWFRMPSATAASLK